MLITCLLLANLYPIGLIQAGTKKSKNLTQHIQNYKSFFLNLAIHEKNKQKLGEKIFKKLEEDEEIENLLIPC